jgi:DNA-binding transcriptional LysR family regulator
MTLEQLRIFVAVAEREHVTAAAATLHLTQSAVSAAVHALETQSAVVLFDRVGRRVVLTDAGRQFLIAARHVLASAGEAQDVLAAIAGLKRGTIRLAASQTVANYWLPSRLAKFRAAHPGIALSLAIGNSQFVRTAVREAAADCGLVEDENNGTDLAPQKVADDELVVVMPADRHPTGRTLAERLKAMPWVCREEGSGTRAIFEQALPSIGLKPAELTKNLELPSNEAVLAAVLAGGGAAALSGLVVAAAVKSGALRKLKLPGLGLTRHFWLVRHGARHIGPAETALRRFLLAKD